MGLAFSRYYRSGHFFWDERAATLEDQVLMPIQDPVEMGMTLGEVVARVQAAPFYADLFTDAFGSPDVTPARISKALAQFTRSMVAPNSRYDQARAIQGGAPQQGPLPGFTMQENMGRQLFFNRGRCAQCHRGDLFVGDIPRNNGLDATITDEGAGGGRFKTSSLRNIAVTAPYMHDGRFATLEEVVEHYSTGIQNSPTLDPRLRDGLGEPVRFNFTDTEKAALVAFLRTLTDDAFLADERWSDPFDGSVASAPAPDALRLEIAGANPVRGATRLRVTGADGRPATVEVFNAAGRRVAVAHDGPLPDGRLVWDPAGLPPGVYVLRLRVGAEGAVRTVAVVR
jgi:cytochrome c peroxidase